MCNTRRTRILPYLLFLAFVVPSPALAQRASLSLGGLSSMVRPEQLVVVVDRSGRETLGHLKSATDSGVTIAVMKVEQRPDGTVSTSTEGERTFPAADIALIMRLDAPQGERTTIYQPQGSFGNLDERVSVGDVVQVWESTGVTVGKVVAVNAAHIVVNPRGVVRDAAGHESVGWTSTPKAFEPPSVTRIKRTGPMWDGALKGFAVGAVFLTVFQGWSEPGIVLFIGGVSSGIGLGIDAAVGAKTVYRAPAPRTRVSLAPVLGTGRHGVAAKFRF